MPAAAIGTIASAAIGGAATIAASRSANSANRAIANAQLTASNNADQIQREANERAFQLEQEQQDYDRWLTSATSAARQPYLDAIAGLVGEGGGGGFAPSSYTPETYTPSAPFQAPDPSVVQNDPAFKFRVGEGEKAIERSAAARGTIKTSGTLKDILSFGQEAASQEYDRMYGRARDEYALNEGLRASAFDRNQAAQFNAAQLNNQSGYQLASLNQSAYGQRLSSLLALAGLASPGQYPGSASGMVGPSPGGSGVTGTGWKVPGAEVPTNYGDLVGGDSGGKFPTEPPTYDPRDNEDMGFINRSLYG